MGGDGLTGRQVTDHQLGIFDMNADATEVPVLRSRAGLHVLPTEDADV